VKKMAVKEILVTGGSGFIGTHLVRRLNESGNRVSCLVRPQSKVRDLQSLGAKLVAGDLNDPASLTEAVKGKDEVFHLAGIVNFADPVKMTEVNVGGTKNLLTACAGLPKPPTVVYVSSLAAAGPSQRKNPHRERDASHPVSNYGISKLAAEKVARTFANRIPISVVRPPVVLGPNDPHGLQLFQMIDRWHLHVIAGYVPQYFSVIHVEDLVEALTAVAFRGERLENEISDCGLYYAAADEIPTYGQLGKMIGSALKKTWVLCLPVPRFSVTAVGAINWALNSTLQTRFFLTYDKAREANAGSWACHNEKLKRETGWAPGASFVHRLEQTVSQIRRQSPLLLRPAP
jgi:nucleoside-diphosphate-sugar epimerase